MKKSIGDNQGDTGRGTPAVYGLSALIGLILARRLLVLCGVIHIIAYH